MAMYSFNDLKDKIKNYFKFSKEETKALVISILVLTFIVGFNDRSSSFVLANWLRNFFIILIVIALSVLVHVSSQKIAGLYLGFNVEYQLWWIGIIIGLVFSIISKGRLWLLFPGGILIHHLAAHRLGYFRYGTNILSMSWISVFGPLSNILLGAFFKTLQLWFNLFPNSTLIDQIFKINLIYALCTLIPIPPLDGAKVFFHSRLIFAFAFGTLFGYLLLLAFHIYSFIGALVIGIIIWLVYYIKFETKFWGGFQ